MSGPATIAEVDLDLGANEISDLLCLHDEQVLGAHGWDIAFWGIRDEGPVDDAITAIGHRAGEPDDRGWEHVDLRVDVGPDAGKTDDSEALARHDRYVYVVGSHYGKKAGPLHPSRQWLARFHESRINGNLRGETIPVQVKRDRFALHRIVNDALAEMDLINSPREYVDAFVGEAQRRGLKKGKGWAKRLDVERDRPMNIEGAAFDEEGILLLGLRSPVTAGGCPIVIGLAGIPEYFEGGREPTVLAAWWISGPGGKDAPVGIRAMRARGDGAYDAVVGSLDATDKGSLLLEHHPEGAHAKSRHVRFTLPAGGGEAEAQTIRQEVDTHRIEGIARDTKGRTVVVLDEDHRVHLRIYDAG